MEENKIWEQPQLSLFDDIVDTNHAQTNIAETNDVEISKFENSTEIENVNNDKQEASGSLGKFKDVESLLNAYNNLQAEFTRKCQKLSEFEKDKTSIQTTSEQQMQDNTSNNETKNTVSQVENNSSDNVSKEDNSQSEIEKVFNNENWSENVAQFLSKHEDAKVYSKEICEEIMQNPTLASDEKALEIAWARIMEKNYKKPEEILNDNFIFDYLQNNENVKNNLLLSLAKEIYNTKLPKTVGVHNGSHIALPKFVPPTNLSQAKEMARKLFE